MLDAVQPIIARLRSLIPAWQSAQNIQAERIAGLMNANYRLTVDGERFVLRVSGQNTERLGINRAHEAAALHAAAAAGIGPQVVAFIPPEWEEVMLDGYFGEITALQRRRLAGMKFMLMLFTGMWGLAQHGMVQAGLISAVEGFDDLEFAEYLFAHDIPQTLQAFKTCGSLEQ
jgi:hypothetical protein